MLLYFVASDDKELLSTPRIPFQNLMPNDDSAVEEEEEEEELPCDLGVDLKRSTNMIITGKMNPEDDTIFLKVRISDQDGQNARNIYFPFDIVNDSAIDVATEMVKELEISDWEPSEIAEMIEKEISSLIPVHKKRGTPQDYHTHQHSFNYEQHDDHDHGHHPFYPFSSSSSSQNSLHAFSSHCKAQFHCGKNISNDQDWLKGDLFINDDASSQNTFSSCNYSNINYCSGNEDDHLDLISCCGKSHKSRFCPSESRAANCYKHCNSQLHNQRPLELNHPHCHHQRKLPMIQSLIDVRSQLLHQSLVEDINKRRLFKTVGAVENIGFQTPGS